MIPMGNRLGFRALDLDFWGLDIGIGKHRGEYTMCILHTVQVWGGYMEQRYMKLYHIHF
jgi:hypothetical protein